MFSQRDLTFALPGDHFYDLQFSRPSSVLGSTRDDVLFVIYVTVVQSCVSRSSYYAMLCYYFRGLL